MEEAYQQALAQLRACSIQDGFVASQTSVNNYHRIWSRDSMVCLLAALMSGEKDLIKTAKKSLLTLMKYQHHQGEIPSNVDTLSGKVSYGGTAGRVDAHLWFLIGFGQYVKYTGDKTILQHYDAHFKKALKLVRLYEFNHKSLLYVPMSGDWADEYPQEGYVLYDQLLYLQAFKEDLYLRKILGRDTSKDRKKIQRISQRITTNFQLMAKNNYSSWVYDKNNFKQALTQGLHKKEYWLSCFNPAGYSSTFDAFANALVLLMNLGSARSQNTLISYIHKHFSEKTHYLLPAFYPVIFPHNKLWSRLRQNHTYGFKNKPYHYHNGGLWPMITGFYVAAIAKRHPNIARKYAQGVHQANEKKNWSFYEYHDSKKFIPSGTRYQAWSAAASIIAHQATQRGKGVLK